MAIDWIARPVTVGILLSAVVGVLGAGCATTRSGKLNHTHNGVTHSHEATAPHSHPFLEVRELTANTGKLIGMRRSYLGPNARYKVFVTGEETAGGYFHYEAIIYPGEEWPMHTHWGEEESFYVLEGTLEVFLHLQTTTARQGDYVNIGRGAKHRIRNIGEQPARLLVHFTPAGIEVFFQKVFVPEFPSTEEVPPPPLTDEMLRRMHAEAADHYIEFAPGPATRPQD